jgi:hypothetical protein
VLDCSSGFSRDQSADWQPDPPFSRNPGPQESIFVLRKSFQPETEILFLMSDQGRPNQQTLFVGHRMIESTPDYR